VHSSDDQYYGRRCLPRLLGSGLDGVAITRSGLVAGSVGSDLAVAAQFGR